MKPCEKLWRNSKIATLTSDHSKIATISKVIEI